LNANEFLAGLAALEGSRESATNGGVDAARLVSGVEYAVAGRSDERHLRALWGRRRGGGATPLVLVADDPDAAGVLRLLGPAEGGPLRRVRAESLLDSVRRTTSMRALAAVRHVAAEVDRLDSEGVAGLTVRGLGTEHLYGTRLRASDRWPHLEELAAGIARAPWREALSRLGYYLEQLPRYGWLARLAGRAVAVVHPKESPAQFARLDDRGRLPEGALLAACRDAGVHYGLLVAGTRLRLLATGGEEAGAISRYLDLDTAALEPADQPLLGLLAPEYLAEGGMVELLAEARDYGQELRKRLDRVLRQEVLPVLGRELGRWAADQGRDLADDRAREDLEAAALTLVFRALFLLYAESAGHLPMKSHTYAERSLTAICRRAAEELGSADPRSTSLWRDICGLVEAMRHGQSAWGVPPYNGDLFAFDGFAGAGTLEAASIADDALGRVLVALARDLDDPSIGVDFSGLEIGHLGHIYEGLLSLRLSLADRDYAYDPRRDRYVAADADAADVRAGELLWLTNEGGRKGGGVYYTRTELVRHLVRGAVGPAFDRHLAEVRELADTDPAAAAKRLFEFYVLDPACGSAHFLVEVLDELADKIAALLGEVPLPAVRDALEDLRRGAGPSFGAGVEDTALLKRLVLKRCVYGVDLSPMGAEIAKVSLWLASFVPGLSLAYLDNNVQVGNSLIGVARPEEVAPPDNGGQGTLFDRDIALAVREASAAAAALRAIEDRTPEEVAESREIHEQARRRVAGARRLFDLWTAEPFGVDGARDEALMRGKEIIAAQQSLLADKAAQIAPEQRFLHWPLAFAAPFDRLNPGFDAVVGNPPWEEITVEELAFYARHRPGLRALAEGPRREELAALIQERADLPGALAAEQERVASQRRYFSGSGSFEGSAGDPDTYKLFCQRYRELLREGGALGVVLPRNAFAAKGSDAFRRWLFERAAPRRIDFLLNTGAWAFDMEPRYTVALLIADCRPPDPDESVEVAGVASSPRAFVAQVEAPGLQIARAALGPNREVPLLPSQAAADLLAKLRSGSPFPLGARRWKCFSVREFDETQDHALWDGATEGWPLWKGESFDQYNPSGAGARICPTSEAVMRKALKPRPGAGSFLADLTSVEERRDAVRRAVGAARVVYRRITRATDSRTIIACLIPPKVFIAYTGPYLAFVVGDDRAQAACLGLMNSLSFDWQARRYVELSLSMTTLESLDLPDLDDAIFDAVASAAARLSCPDDRFADFAAATGVECGPLDDEARERLRAEIDAWVAHAWKLTPGELEVVFSDFTLDAVPESYRQRVRERFAELG
jgi:hypothetical protein